MEDEDYMQVRKTDFQYGALLSVLINSGNPPILVGESDKRNIYQIDTNRGSYYIYALSLWEKEHRTLKKPYR
ncbi:hypothetical protein CD798_09830 [Bacillaceae bacterium SAOS 7]|nr:hypothetical protein CD798_09830 [Bacillaceae bacterium SAOS 7]